MTQRYFAQTQGQTVGPMPATALKKMAQEGRLSPDDLVWKEGTHQNVKAGQISGLFRTSPKQSPSPSSTASSTASPSPSPTASGTGSWHYAKSGVGSDSVAGPHTLAEMKQLLAAKQIHAATFVAGQGTKNQWVELRETALGQLLPAETQPAAPAAERQDQQAAIVTPQAKQTPQISPKQPRSAVPPLGTPPLNDSGSLPPQLSQNSGPVPQVRTVHHTPQPRTNSPVNKLILAGVATMVALLLLVAGIYAVTNVDRNPSNEVAQSDENDSEPVETSDAAGGLPDDSSPSADSDPESPASPNNFSAEKRSPKPPARQTTTKAQPARVNKALKNQLTIDISRTETALRLADSSATTVFQQQVGRVDACLGVTDVVARALGASSSEVSTIHSRMRSSDALAETVFQQLAGHLTAHFNMLKLAAQKAGASASTITAVESSLRLNDRGSETVNQQIAARILGVMKMAEVLAESIGSASSTTSAITSSVNLNDARSQTVYQQMSARQTGVVKMLGAAARASGSGSASVSTVERGLITDDALVDTAQQQYSARIKRAYEMTRLLAKTLVGQ